MTAGRELNRLLWAVGEARRLRRDEALDRRGAEAEEPAADQPGAVTGR